MNTKDKLKSIFYPVDSITPLCQNCPPIITQQSENFIYDSLGRLTSRTILLTTLSNNPVKIDTSEVYSYFYLDNTAVISYYTQTINNYVTDHALTYNSNKQLISDSVTNPQISNNKISHFDYVQNNIIEVDKQTYPIGTETTIDTMTTEDNNVVTEIVWQFISKNPENLMGEELSWSFTTYQNPLGIVNNISLIGSDHKNGAENGLFYHGENFSNNFPSQEIEKDWNNNLTWTEYTPFYYTTTFDSSGRIISGTNIGDRNRVTMYEYY